MRNRAEDQADPGETVEIVPTASGAATAIVTEDPEQATQQAFSQYLTNQLDQRTDADVGPDNVEIQQTEDGGFSADLTEEFRRERAQSNLEDELEDQFRTNLQPGEDFTIQKTDDGFKATLTDEFQRQQAESELQERLEQEFQQDLNPGEDFEVRETEDGYQVNLTDEFQQRRAQSALETNLEDQLNRDLEIGDDFQVQQTDEGFRAELTDDFRRQRARSELETNLETELDENLQPGEDFEVRETEDGFEASLTEEFRRERAAEQLDDQVGAFNVTSDDVVQTTRDGETVYTLSDSAQQTAQLRAGASLIGGVPGLSREDVADIGIGSSSDETDEPEETTVPEPDNPQSVLTSGGITPGATGAGQRADELLGQTDDRIDQAAGEVVGGAIEAGIEALDLDGDSPQTAVTDSNNPQSVLSSGGITPGATSAGQRAAEIGGDIADASAEAGETVQEDFVDPTADAFGDLASVGANALQAADATVSANRRAASVGGTGVRQRNEAEINEVTAEQQATIDAAIEDFEAARADVSSDEDTVSGAAETATEKAVEGIGSNLALLAGGADRVRSVGDTTGAAAQYTADELQDDGLAGGTSDAATAGATAAGARLAQTATQAVENPIRTGGQLIGSAVVMGGAAKLSSSAGLGTRAAIQPGEELIGYAGNKVLPGRAGSTLFPDNEPLLMSEESAIRGVRSGARRARNRAQRTRELLSGDTELTPSPRQQALIEAGRPTGGTGVLETSEIDDAVPTDTASTETAGTSPEFEADESTVAGAQSEPLGGDPVRTLDVTETSADVRGDRVVQAGETRTETPAAEEGTTQTLGDGRATSEPADAPLQSEIEEAGGVRAYLRGEERTSPAIQTEELPGRLNELVESERGQATLSSPVETRQETEQPDPSEVQDFRNIRDDALELRRQAEGTFEGDFDPVGEVETRRRQAETPRTETETASETAGRRTETLRVQAQSPTVGADARTEPFAGAQPLQGTQPTQTPGVRTTVGPDTQQRPGVDTGVDTVLETDQRFDTETATDVFTDTFADTEVESETEVVTRLDTEVDSETELYQETEVETETEAEQELEFELEFESEQEQELEGFFEEGNSESNNEFAAAFDDATFDTSFAEAEDLLGFDGSGDAFSGDSL